MTGREIGNAVGFLAGFAAPFVAANVDGYLAAAVIIAGFQIARWAHRA